MRPSLTARSMATLSVLATLSIATPALAQHYGSGSGHAGGYSSGWDVRSQLDRPGDYRCDAYWDANRTDCGAAWRDQRRYASDNRYGGGNGYNRYGYSRGQGYGSSYGNGYSSGGTAYYGAYGRPDLVYPGGRGRSYTSGYTGGYGSGYGGGHGQIGARDPRRVDWCRSSYRSYDPASGYYRAYSGRLVFCG